MRLFIYALILAVVLTAGCSDSSRNDAPAIRYYDVDGCNLTCLNTPSLALSCDWAGKTCAASEPLIDVGPEFYTSPSEGCDKIGCFTLTSGRKTYTLNFNDLTVEGCDDKGCFKTLENRRVYVHVYNLATASQGNMTLDTTLKERLRRLLGFST